MAHITSDLTLSLTNREISDRSLQMIAETSWIHSLSLRDCKISNESLGRLAKLNLIGLNVSGTNFDDLGAAKISSCKELQSIDARMTAISDEGVSKLCPMPCLKKLVLSGTRVTDQALTGLAKSKQLESLSLENAKLITSDGLCALKQTHLQDLYLADTLIDDKGLACISGIQSLRTLVLSRTKVTVDGVEKLLRVSKIHTIHLAGCPNIGQKEIEKWRTQFRSVVFGGHDSYGADDGAN